MSKEGLEQKFLKEALDINRALSLGPNDYVFERDLKRYVVIGSRLNKCFVTLSAVAAVVHLVLQVGIEAYPI